MPACQHARALQGSPSARLALNPCLAAAVGLGHICKASGGAPRHWLPIEPAGHAGPICMHASNARRARHTGQHITAAFMAEVRNV